MKQLEMTPELSALIKKAVGEDVDTEKLAVFETIALNTQPLPGKRGTIFEKAVIKSITLAQMVDHINSGNHLPLILDHELVGAPMGRFFHAGLNYTDGELEMRALFYLDETESHFISKLNSGSLDEVSVSFLSTQFVCSACDFDYFNAQFSSNRNFDTRTCANGHTIGADGVHAEMIGLSQFIELSLVARGAASKPKIVGKSQAVLAPEIARRLAASGFEPDELVVQASLGKKVDTMDPAQLADYLAKTEKVATLTAERPGLELRATTAETRVAELSAQVGTLTTELAAAKDAKPAGFDEAVSESTSAVAFLQAQVDHLLVASGKPKMDDSTKLTKVADLKAKIEELTGGLTSIIPVGGVSRPAGENGEKTELTFNPSAFALRK